MTSGIIRYNGIPVAIQAFTFPDDDKGISYTGETIKIRMTGDFDSCTILVQENMGPGGWVDYLDNGTDIVKFDADAGFDVHLASNHQIRFSIVKQTNITTNLAVFYSITGST